VPTRPLAPQISQRLGVPPDALGAKPAIAIQTNPEIADRASRPAAAPQRLPHGAFMPPVKAFLPQGGAVASGMTWVGAASKPALSCVPNCARLHSLIMMVGRPQ
jgi:hypothetical protein